MNIYVSVLLWITYGLSLYFSIFFILVFAEKTDFFKRENNAKNRLKLEHFPYVSVCIPAYNEENTIVGTIRSVLNLDYPKEKLEVIVVDDGSKDNTKKIVENFISGKKCVKLISHANMGKAASMNKALGLCKGEFFVCLDADSYVDRLTLRKMLSMYYKEKDPDLAVITPAMKIKSPKSILQRIQRIEYIVMIFFGRLTSHLDCLYVAPGPFSLYNTSILRKLGGFDTKTLTEDQEIAYRAQMHNYRIKQCFDAYVYTEAPAKLNEFYSQRRRWYKGGLTCVNQYKNMIMDKKYGDFGVFQMTKNVIGFLLAISCIGFASYFIFWPILERIYNLFLINFDIWPLLRNFKLNFNILNVDFRKGVVASSLFATSFIFFYYSHINANERVRKYGILPLLPYFLVYYLVKGFIFIFSMAELAVQKNQKW